DAEEIAISNSTPICRFGVPAKAPEHEAEPVAVEAAPEAARRFVAEAIGDPAQPVVLFALEWCEFSWSVRRFLRDINVPFRSVDLDSVAMQADDMGGAVRRALAERIGVPTIPQLFVGGVHVGGATDVLGAWDAGGLAPLLETAGAATKADPGLVAASYLPKWLAARPAA